MKIKTKISNVRESGLSGIEMKDGQKLEKILFKKIASGIPLC